MPYQPMPLLAVFAALALLPAGITAQTVSFDSRHAGDIARNPPDLHFRLDVAGGQRTFHMGERIPLVLSFSSDTPAKYKLNAATYDRGGRLPTEEFVMEQAASDPYIDYFGAGVLGGLGGGIRGYPVLDREAVTIELELNQWFRFERPGLYRLYLKSHRLTREAAPGEADRETVEFAAVSNIVEIEILSADAAWESAKVAGIKAILDSDAAQRAGAKEEKPLVVLPDEKVRVAWRELEYLGTPEAVRTAFEMAHQTGESPSALLLFAARDRKAMVLAFDAYLADPQVTIGQWDIRIRAAFAWMERDKPQPLPVFPWEKPDRAALQKLQEVAAGRQTRFNEFLQAEAIRLIPVVAAKSPTARKDSGESIAAFAEREARMADLIPPDDYGLTRDQLIAQFATFPEDRQMELLGRKWDLVRGPDMIPALKQVLAGEQPKPTMGRAMGLQVWGVESGVAISALQRLAELSRQEVAGIIGEDIASGTPRFAGYAVRELPPQDLPGVDDALLAGLDKDFEATMPLVAKFASARLLPEVRRRAREHPARCALEQPVVIYFVRVVPTEDGEGRAMLRQALDRRENCGWFRMLLHNVARVAWTPAIRAEAMARLDDQDPEVVASAASVLAQYGEPEVEAHLWKRLEKWSKQWRGRVAELEGHPIAGGGRVEEERLGTALFDSIANAQAWLLDDARRKRLAALCVQEGCRKRWETPQRDGMPSITVANGGWMYPPSYQIGGYSSPTWDGLKRKLLQYPGGTAFCWTPSSGGFSEGFSPGQIQDMFRELTTFLTAHSMRIEACSP